mgnify:CR=1 FL=1
MVKGNEYWGKRIFKSSYNPGGKLPSYHGKTPERIFTSYPAPVPDQIPRKRTVTTVYGRPSHEDKERRRRLEGLERMLGVAVSIGALVLSLFLI